MPQVTQVVIVKLLRTVPLSLVLNGMMLLSFLHAQILNMRLIETIFHIYGTSHCSMKISYHWNHQRYKYGLIKSSHVFMFQDKEACQMNELIGRHPLAREILHIAIEIGFL